MKQAAFFLIGTVLTGAIALSNSHRVSHPGKLMWYEFIQEMEAGLSADSTVNHGIWRPVFDLMADSIGYENSDSVFYAMPDSVWERITDRHWLLSGAEKARYPKHRLMLAECFRGRPVMIPYFKKYTGWGIHFYDSLNAQTEDHGFLLLHNIRKNWIGKYEKPAFRSAMGRRADLFFERFK